MKKALGLYLAAAMTVGTALSQDAPGAAEPTLQVGIKHFGDGDLAGAVFTFETVIRALGVEPALHAKDLSQAYLYRGAAFVGLSQEENAKGSFAAALQYDKTLRISDDKFSPRVVRVFEAARTGKTKSVLLPPSNVAKKAGLGALGIAGIIAGVAAIGGGVAAATHSSAAPTTTTTTTTLPPRTTETLSGSVRVFADGSFDPQGGTTFSITGSGTVMATFSFTPVSGITFAPYLVCQSGCLAFNVTAGNYSPGPTISATWSLPSGNVGTGTYFVELAPRNEPHAGIPIHGLTVPWTAVVIHP